MSQCVRIIVEQPALGARLAWGFKFPPRPLVAQFWSRPGESWEVFSARCARSVPEILKKLCQHGLN